MIKSLFKVRKLNIPRQKVWQDMKCGKKVVKNFFSFHPCLFQASQWKNCIIEALNLTCYDFFFHDTLYAIFWFCLLYYFCKVFFYFFSCIFVHFKSNNNKNRSFKCHWMVVRYGKIEKKSTMQSWVILMNANLKQKEIKTRSCALETPRKF